MKFALNTVGSNVFKTGSGFGLGVALVAGLLWWNLPISITRSTDIARGKELIVCLEQYEQQHNKLPGANDWATLRQIGFTTKEIERASPEYAKLDSTTYQLVFVSGFDGPYLMWNSRERKWKIALPAAVNN